MREVVEEVAFQARADRKIDKRSGVSQRLPITTLELVVSNAERRALANGETLVVPRVTDVYAALPSITGKFELEYEGELRGAEQVARDLIRAAVGNGLRPACSTASTRARSSSGSTSAASLPLSDTHVGRRRDRADARRAGAARAGASAPASRRARRRRLVASAIDFVLEGLYAQKKISRSDERGYSRAPKPAAPRRGRGATSRRIDEEIRMPAGKKKYYN